MCWDLSLPLLPSPFPAGQTRPIRPGGHDVLIKGVITSPDSCSPAPPWDPPQAQAVRGKNLSHHGCPGLSSLMELHPVPSEGECSGKTGVRYIPVSTQEVEAGGSVLKSSLSYRRFCLKTKKHKFTPKVHAIATSWQSAWVIPFAWWPLTPALSRSISL